MSLHFGMRQPGVGHGRSEGVGVAYNKLAIPQAFSAKLTANSADLKLLILGDSIGNEYVTNIEWVARMAAYWAAFAPNYLVRDYLYNDTTNVYEAKQMTGESAGSSLFSDNFNRADGAVGTSSGGQGYGTVTAWAISGNHVVQNTGSNLLAPASNLGNDKHVIEVDFTVAAINDAVRVYGLYTSGTSTVYLALTSSGAMSLNVNTGSAVALITQGTSGALSIAETIHLKLIVDGDWLKGEVTRGGTTYTVAAQLTSVQKAALTGTKFALTAITVGTGAYFDNLAVNNLSETRRLDIHNASVAGAGIAYHRSELVTTRPVSMDAVVIAMGHNEGSNDATTFLANMDLFVADILAAQPGLPIIIMSENPEISPATNYLAQNARMAALPAWAASKGHGLLDRYATYNSTYTNADGIHPTNPGSDQIASENKTDFAI